MTYEERIFIFGATGNTGKPAVQKLLSNPKIALTLYTRTPAKVQELYGEQAEDRVKIVQGDFDDLKPYEDNIKGHTRLYILVNSHDYKKKALIVRKIAEIAYDAGAQQIVYLSSICASLPWRSLLLAAADSSFEEAILSIPNRKAFVTLRPAYFMSNQAMGDIATVKALNKIMDTREPDQAKQWISPNDIGEVAANVLQDPIEKHGDAVYEMIGDCVAPKDHAAILSRVLGRPIAYEKITEQQFYDSYIANQVSHSVAYMFLKMSGYYTEEKATPGLSILLGHPPETLEHWIEQNKSEFS